MSQCFAKSKNCIKNHFYSLTLASPATCKLGLRMTTLHEEPSSLGPRQDLAEEPEDSYSDPEYNEYEDEKIMQKPQIKSRFPTSKTMGSLTEIGSSHHNSIGQTANNGIGTSAIGPVQAKHIVGTPSMTSSASSGYGSQVNVRFSSIKI